MCKLSIVIPVYNGSPYIEECLRNLEKQTMTDWEAIFVNDGSADNSWEILKKIKENRANIQIVSQKNGGTARARNAGLERVSGKYVTFMDVDDELAPDMYKKLVRLMESSGADMGICGYYFKIEAGAGSSGYLEEKTFPSCVLKNPEQIKEKLVQLWDADMLSNVWNKIYRMDLIRAKNLRYRDGHVYTEDRVFNRLFLENCGSVAVLQDCLYYYIRERAGSTSEKYRDNYFDIRHKEYIEFQTHFKAMGAWDDEAREYVSREFVERIAGCIENLFHAKGSLSEKQKKEKIRSFITHPDVQEALKYARCRSKKMRILAAPLKMRNTELTYLIYKAVYIVRKNDPALFHKLKGKR